MRTARVLPLQVAVSTATPTPEVVEVSRKIMNQPVRSWALLSAVQQHFRLSAAQL